jgi:hypothetical protein
LIAWCSRKIRSFGNSWIELARKQRKMGLPNSRTCLIRGWQPEQGLSTEKHEKDVEYWEKLPKPVGQK